MLLTECPMKTASSSEVAPDLDDIVGIARQARILVSVVGAEVEPPAPTWSNRIVRKSLSKAGATNRHIFWSRPKPWANIIAFSPLPRMCTLFRSTTRHQHPF